MEQYRAQQPVNSLYKNSRESGAVFVLFYESITDDSSVTSFSKNVLISEKNEQQFICEKKKLVSRFVCVLKFVMQIDIILGKLS